MGQCLEAGRRMSQNNSSNDSCCSQKCLSETSIAQMDGVCEDYAVLCHKTPSTICDEWWTKTVRSNGVINVCMMGTKGIGRNELFKRLTGKDKFGGLDVDCDIMYDPTQCDTAPGEYTLPLDIGNRHCKLHIHSLEECNLIFPHSQRRGDCLRFGQIFLCCFAIDSQDSYRAALDAHNRILRHKEGESDYSIILVATKCDGERNVDQVEAMEFAKDNGIGYIETSAKENQNVSLLFERSIFEHWAQTVCNKANNHQDNEESVDVHDGGNNMPKLPSVSISNSQSTGITPQLTPGSSGHSVSSTMSAAMDMGITMGVTMGATMVENSQNTPDGQETSPQETRM